jgi:hypothetical protein
MIREAKGKLGVMVVDMRVEAIRRGLANSVGIYRTLLGLVSCTGNGAISPRAEPIRPVLPARFAIA